MKKNITAEEFEDRTKAILRAHKIFIDSGVTKNITLAFELYQTICADRERELTLTTQAADRPPYPLDKYERPKCPECGSDMMLRDVPENDDGIKIQLICSNRQCDTVLNDEHDLKWWLENLELKDESGRIPENPEKKQ